MAYLLGQNKMEIKCREVAVSGGLTVICYIVQNRK